MKEPIPNWMLAEVAEYDLEIVPPPATILDIGANIGAFSLHYAAKWPLARIEAYEPVESNFDQLLENVRHVSGINPNNFAVRDFSGPAEIYIGDLGVTCGFYQRGRQTTKTQKVNCIPCRSLASHELVKIDTEGCELEIIEGLDLSKTRAVVCEYHSLADVAPITCVCNAAGLDLLENAPGSHEHGVLKFARPGAGVSLPVSALRSPVSSAARKVFIALAINREVTAPTMMSLAKLIASGRASGKLRFNNQDGVARSRNRLAADFLETDCTHLLFIDSDIVFTVEDFDRVTGHDVPVVGGLYPLRGTEDLEWCAEGIVPPPPIRPDGLQQVKRTGTGFMCIAREVFERMLLQFGHEIEYTSDMGGQPQGSPRRTEWDFWPMGVYQFPDGSRRYLTEDWFFCQKWMDMGGEIFADTHALLQHVGAACWPLPHQQKAFLEDQKPKAAGHQLSTPKLST